MWCHKSWRWALLIAVSMMGSACSDGILGGGITAQFTGINKAVILGPETVSIDWKPDPKCDNYQIYSLSSSTTSALMSASVPPVIIRDPLVASERAYTFAVGCIRNGLSTGLDLSVNVSTWREFTGAMNTPETLPGGQFRLSWEYLADTGTKFLVYAIESQVPGVEQKLTRVDPTGYKGHRKGYQEAPVCVTFSNRLIIGPGGDCDPGQNLLRPGSLYQFRVVAQYPDNNFSEDRTGNYQERLIDSSFTPPSCSLTQRGLGADEASTYLYLRCSTAGNTSNNACPFNLLSVKAYQGVSGVRKPISDTLTLNPSGSNLLEIQAVPGQNATNSRLVENLEIEFTCSRPGITEKASIRYDGSQLKYPKPVLKYGSSKPGRKYELAPEHSYLVDARAAQPTTQAPSKFGTVTATGDFDCDGNPDLAVGLPEITLNQSPYFNETYESGAVKVYYNYTKTATGTITADNGIQLLSFRDLPDGAHFGASLSAGNVNRDVYKREGDVYYSCDDLVIGAPADGNSGSTTPGRAFIFYGQPQKFPQQPLNFLDLAKNAESCGGDFSSSNCAPVELIRDMSGRFRVDPANTDLNTSTGSSFGTKSAFGFKVSYVRDFNADGYGDVAVTDPYCMWDGYNANDGIGYNQTGNNNSIPEVGCFYLYFGGPSGIQSKPVAVAPDSGNPFFPTASFNGTSLNNAVISPFIKVYPPIVQPYMHFGATISGGGDIDGRLPVPIPMPGGGVIFANGDDFVVGAPDFSYKYTFGSVSSPVSTASWTPPNTESGGTAQDPLSNQTGSGNAASPKFIPPLNKAWDATNAWSSVPNPTNTGNTTHGLYNSTGVAFAYLGRHAYKSYPVKMRSGTLMKLFPIGALTVQNDFLSEVMSQLSLSVRDRQNGSSVIQFDSGNATIDAHISPIRSFYNCGVRGSPTSRDATSNYYEHFSCLAGRNNFSVIFPTIADNELAVSGFGAELSILGSKEQNAVALYNLQSDLGASSFVEPTSTVQGQRNLMYLAQGNVHDRIRGTSLWEVGVKDFQGSALGGSLTGTNLSSGPGNATADQPNLTLVRSAVNETLIIKDGVTSMINSPLGGSKPQVDLNRDGYADVAVGTRYSNFKANIFTYFGNHAADFAYTYKNPNLAQYTDNGAFCNIQRPTLAAFGAGESIKNDDPLTDRYFRTFSGRAQAFVGSKVATLSSEFPVTRHSNSAQFSWYLGDVAAGYTMQNRTFLTSAKISCKPQIKSLTATPTDFSAGDLDNDGITDLAVGMSGENSNQGKALGILGGATGNGFAPEQVFTIPEVGARFGSSVSALNWRFIVPVVNPGDLQFNESYRRELWVGASGLSSGSGGVYNFKSGGAGAIQLSLNIGAPFRDQSNTPNNLNAENSKIIGDINGDGFDDIWAPVKRTNTSGDEYYDAMVFFGSSFGTVTNSFCKENVSKMSYQNGGALNVSVSECLGSNSSLPVYIGATQVRLPQYFSKATPLGVNSLLYTHSAGDVNKDGRGDAIVFDTSNTHLHLFFGSEGGLVNGQPISGPSSNRTPQWVSNEIYLPASAWSYQIETWERSKIPVVAGDFNGDGYDDMAIGQPVSNGPRFNGTWNCSPMPPTNSANYAECIANPGLGVYRHGNVAVMYGGPYGYQVPTSGQFNFNATTTCGNFLTGCTVPPATTTSFSEVYGSLSFNASNDGFTIEEANLTCSPAAAPGENCNGRGTLIRNPAFYNTNFSFNDLANSYFGSALSVGDYNGDGIADLAVGAPKHHLPDYGDSSFSAIFGGSPSTNTGEAYASSLYGQQAGASVGDVSLRGAVFIYYGSKGGLIAPEAKKLLGDNGMALYKDGIPKADSAAVAFALSPPAFDSVSPGTGTVPELDSTTSGRMFGVTLASGDYNGDKVADLAVSSVKGQIYIIYGPICGTDNARASWRDGVYANHNSALAFNSTLPAAADRGNCRVANFNRTSNLANFQTQEPASVALVEKTLYPQMIYVDGVAAGGGHLFGATLISAMPGKGGNIDGDPGKSVGDSIEGTSDLVVGGYNMNDANVTTVGGKPTGMAYVLFGHKAPISPDDMTTTPGLYVKSPSYNMKLITTPNGNFYRSPLILRPYETDGSVAKFFGVTPSMGDLNGDLTGDLLMPTEDLHVGADQSTQVIKGGGFKLFE